MAQSEAEKLAAAAMIAAVTKEKDNMFSYMRYLADCGPEALRACGHKELGTALISALSQTRTRIAKIEKEFLKKFPD